jgi:hypothetical protein
MPTVKIAHEFDCDEQTLWKMCFFDEEYTRRLYHETLRFPVYRMLDQKLTDDALVRRIEIQPLIENVPGAIKGVLGDKFGYVEEGTLDRTVQRYRFRIVPNVLPEKTTISGEMFSEKVSDDRTRRIVSFSIEVKVFAVGRVLEQKTIDDTKASYDKIAVFTRDYLKQLQGA